MAKQKIEILDSKIRTTKWMLKIGKTKKECCINLGIAYNTTRLKKIIEEFDHRQNRLKELKEKAKLKKFTESNKTQIVEDYLSGEAMSTMAERLYVPSTRIRAVLIEKQIPIRGKGKKSQVKTAHIVKDDKKKYKKGDRIYVVPAPYYETIDEKGKAKQIFAHKAGYAKVTSVLDETFCDVWDEGITKEYIKWAPHVDIESKTFKKHWPNGPVEGQHYNVFWINVEGDSYDRLSLQMKYTSHLSIIAKYGVEGYMITLEEDGSNRFITRNEIYEVPGMKTNEI